ncbi:MAG: ribonuclease HII [Lachnospiraceae bacterium]|nr:ribonuclease HII [Lachnospiraceae bacterium]
MANTTSIALIKEQFKAASIEELSFLIEQHQDDERSGVKALVAKAQKTLLKLEKEKERIEALCKYEKQYPDADYICGIDEVGRGPLAGPVVAGAVILPKDCRILYINDSKKLSEAKREMLYDEIMDAAIAVGIGVISPARIDEINILQATYEAMRMAIDNLSVTPDILLNDAVTIPKVEIPQVPIIKGDAKSISIGAASIMAKVTRDRMMVQYDQMFPGYGFAHNKGYGSAEHIEALKKFGPTEIHRKSFIGHFV